MYSLFTIYKYSILDKDNTDYNIFLWQFFNFQGFVK